MYAVIRTGGKQYRVAQGDHLDVERIESADGGELQFSPVLVVDGASVLAAPAQLADARVTARVLGEAAGPKITGFTYKAKTNQRRRWGHRQHYTKIEITGISAGARRDEPGTGEV